MNWKFWKKKEEKVQRHGINPWTECICPACGKNVRAFEPCDCDDTEEDLEESFRAWIRGEEK